MFYTLIKLEFLTPSQRARVLSILYIQIQLISHHMHLFIYLLFNIYYLLFVIYQNACTSNPCLFNGTCLSGFTDKKYQCVCTAYSTGQNCETGKEKKKKKKRIAAGQTLWCMHMLLNLPPRLFRGRGRLSIIFQMRKKISLKYGRDFRIKSP